MVAAGPRSSVIALAAGALEEKAIRQVEVIAPLGSLKEIVESNWTFDQAPELFCFGLLEQFDVKQIASLVAPRPVIVRQPDARAEKELGELKAFYKSWGKDFDPLKAGEEK